MKNIPEALLKPFDSQAVEGPLYKLWEQSGFFNPDNLPGERSVPYTIIMPPPNANGRLHAGHGLVMTLEDLVIRFQRMQGKLALWVPGADHAGFETQVVYEKKLEKEGRSRFGMDRKELYDEIYSFTMENKKHMENDVRRLGASCDWSREKFTLDPQVVTAVQDTFRKMFNDGLIYRGDRIVNWCSKHQTSLSDVETEYKEKTDKFYYLKYGPFTIGTARPETKFGDKYVVMHPDDERYKEYKHGDKFAAEWINGPIVATVIKDDSIDMEFGTGVMTITPWHDQVDFDIAQRHNLDKEQIIDLYGKLLPIAGEFAGMKIKDAREKIIEKLQSKGLVEKVEEDYKHNVRVCYKCETTIEPQIKDQWFVKMKPLAKLALDAIEHKEMNFYPSNYEQIFKYWMENTLDWNISRQIVWGIPIPAKVCTSCNFGTIDTNESSICSKCGGVLVGETDTFDTWFSSGQWTLLALGHPNEKDLSRFHPTSLMETGKDLIFKWIPRMTFFSLYLRNEIAFKDIYLNGMVNDEKGQKMSKSKGNVISPIDIIDEFGADAFRMGMIVGSPAGSDVNLSKQKIKAYKLFSNKIWNATRFVLERTTDHDKDTELTEEDQKLYDSWREKHKDITTDLENYRFHLAAEKIYDYFWKVFCDEIIETRKVRILEDKDKASAQTLLLRLLREQIITLHPFMPFITEEVWKFVKKEEDELLLVTSW